MIDVRPEEVRALAWSWLYIFSVFSSYYIIRPIRDEMGVAGGVENLPWLFTGTLVGMMAVNPPFAALVKTLPRERFISVAYRFFMTNLLLFVLLLKVSTAGAEHLGRPRLLHLDLRLQPVRRVRLLGAHGRCLRRRAGEAALRLHRGRGDARGHRWARA